MAWAVKKGPSLLHTPAVLVYLPFYNPWCRSAKMYVKKDVMVAVECHATWRYVPTFYVVVCKAG